MIYHWITSFRNYLYDKQLLDSVRFDLPVIGVGNLAVGGTGKTPHVEYLLRLLKNYKRATLSRGYKRKTKGFVLADETSNAANLGDEPFQYFSDFKDITVAVSEDRVAGIKKLCDKKTETEVIILDDAFQHRPVQPSLNILITDYKRLFFKDQVLPFGRLRESRFGAKRADMVIVSKCPASLSEQEKMNIKTAVWQYAQKKVPVFFTTYKYSNPLAFGKKSDLKKRVVLVSGIANPKPLQEYLEMSGFEVIEHFNYPDHYAFKLTDLKKWIKLMKAENEQVSFITTRKDATRIQLPEFTGLLQELPFFYIPIAVEFLENQTIFDALVLDHIQRFKKAKLPV